MRNGYWSWPGVRQITTSRQTGPAASYSLRYGNKTSLSVSEPIETIYTVIFISLFCFDIWAHHIWDSICEGLHGRRMLTLISPCPYWGHQNVTTDYARCCAEHYFTHSCLARPRLIYRQDLYIACRALDVHPFASRSRVMRTCYYADCLFVFHSWMQHVYASSPCTYTTRGGAPSEW